MHPSICFILLVLGVSAMAEEEDCRELWIRNYAYPTHVVQYPESFGIPADVDAPFVDLILAKLPPKYYPYIQDELTYPFGLAVEPTTTCNLLPGVPEEFYSLLINDIVIRDLKRRLDYLEKTDDLERLEELAGEL